MSKFPTEIDQLLERQKRLLSTTTLAVQRPVGVDLADRLLKMSNSSAAATLAGLSGLRSMQKQLDRYGGIHTQLTGANSLAQSLSRLSGLFPISSISVLDRISPVSALEKAWSRQALGLESSRQLAWVNEIARRASEVTRLQQSIANGGLTLQQAALARVESHLPQNFGFDAPLTDDRIDAMLRAIAELSQQVSELQRDARKPALLRADFLIAQLLIIFVLLFTLAIQAADDQTQDLRWDQLQTSQAQILALERQQVQALAKEYRAQYVVKTRTTSLRSSDKAKAPVVALLYPNTRVHLVASRGPWVRVELFDLARGEYRYGWCLKKYLSRLKSSADR